MFFKVSTDFWSKEFAKKDFVSSKKLVRQTKFLLLTPTSRACPKYYRENFNLDTIEDRLSKVCELSKIVSV
ncbi:MAG: hypothetical protein ACPLZF_05975, partial [Nitrososphaeria archaeon]